MSLSSADEDALFAEWGWEKDLIQRRYTSPRGQVITFDEIMLCNISPDAERELVEIIKAYGKRQGTQR